MIRIKSRYTHGGSAQAPFDYAFLETPGDNYISNNGVGVGDSFAPSSGIWARSAIANTTIEALLYD